MFRAHMKAGGGNVSGRKACWLWKSPRDIFVEWQHQLAGEIVKVMVPVQRDWPGKGERRNSRLRVGG